MAHGVSSADLWRVAVRVAVAALALGAALWLAVALRGVLELVFGGVVLSAGLGPLVRRLGRLRIPRAPAALLILLALGAAAAGFLALALPPTIAEAEALLRRAPAVGDGMVAGARALQERFPLLPPIETQFAGLAQALGSQLGAFAAQALGVARVALGVVDGLLSLLVLLLVTLYLVVDGDRVREYLLSFWPTERETWLRGVADRVGQRLSGWLAGQVALSAAVGLLSFAGLALLGVDGALLLALVAAAGEVVPIVGPILSAVPAVLAAAVQDPLKGLAVAVLYLLIQQVENNLLVPRIMGARDRAAPPGGGARAADRGRAARRRRDPPRRAGCRRALRRARRGQDGPAGPPAAAGHQERSGAARQLRSAGQGRRQPANPHWSEGTAAMTRRVPGAAGAAGAAGAVSACV